MVRLCALGLILGFILLGGCSPNIVSTVNEDREITVELSGSWRGDITSDGISESSFYYEKMEIVVYLEETDKIGRYTKRFDGFITLTSGDFSEQVPIVLLANNYDENLVTLLMGTEGRTYSGEQLLRFEGLFNSGVVDGNYTSRLTKDKVVAIAHDTGKWFLKRF